MKNISFLIINVFIICQLASQDRSVGLSFSTRSEIIAQNGMAATSQPLATQAAIDILKAGGSAVDAAIAANSVLAVVEPMSNGIGGDLFAIVWDAKSKSLHGLNASGRSPGELTLEKLKAMNINKIPLFGVLSISVPGCVDGWFELHQKFGKLSMQEVLQPAIDYAKNGFPVSEVIAYDWSKAMSYVGNQPGFKEVFLNKGEAPKKGEIFKNPALANSLLMLSKEGRSSFYNGKIAEYIVSFVRANGGFLSKEDFSSHRSEWIKPVSTNYRGFDVWELPPNGQGIAALQMLNVLEQFDIRKMGFGSQEYMHLLIEAKKLAYEDRAKYYADPAFNQIPVEELISKSYARDRSSLISMDKAGRRILPGDVYNQAEAIEKGNTIYLTVADKEGNMVSLIQSNYWEFGSGVTPPNLGFALQNRGEMFSFEEGHFNQYAPNKRPFHTIIPAFLTKENEMMISFGVMGGAMQPQGHAQIVVNLVDFDMNLQEAGDAPRIRHMGSSQPTGSKMKDSGRVLIESGYDIEVIRSLMSMGHNVQYAVGAFGGYQAIKIDLKNKIYYGASDPRKDGQASGY